MELTSNRRWTGWVRGQSPRLRDRGKPLAHSFVVKSEEIELGQIRSKFLKQAVLWVCELADRDKLEANHAADELRRYFESVLDSLPPEERGSLSEEIHGICQRLEECEHALHR